MKYTFPVLFLLTHTNTDLNKVTNGLNLMGRPKCCCSPLHDPRETRTMLTLQHLKAWPAYFLPYPVKQCYSGFVFACLFHGLHAEWPY